MPGSDDNHRPCLPRLLVTAFHFDSAHSMESRLSWQRAQHATAEYDVTVICAHGRSGGDGMSTVKLPLNPLERALMSNTLTYYVGYRLWHRRVYKLAQRLHAECPFGLVHHVSFCGYREPSDCWRLGIPFVWGPVGGTRPFPWRFLRELDIRGAARELMRNIVNAGQLRFGFRVRRAMKAAASVLAANHEVAADITKTYGVSPRVQLETGIAQARTAPRAPRDPSAPLRILWAGRLRSWKALPLLLRALAELPDNVRYTLRVMGQGNCRNRWNRLAVRLGIASHIEWVGWPEYREQLPHYEWADVFAFTSLRDTSGTGLLEALAAGTPIIGVDHHGAADIMTPACAVSTPADRPRATIEGLSQAIRLLASDEALRCALSEGAIARAREFSWQRQWEETREIYENVLTSSLARPATSASARRDAPDEGRVEETGFQGMLTPQEAL